MIELIVYGLATWRVSSLLVNETGPWSLFRRLREAVGISYDDLGRESAISDGLLAGIFSCMWCCSMWVGLGWMGLAWLLPEFSLNLAMWLAFSAVAIGWEKKVIGK